MRRLRLLALIGSGMLVVGLVLSTPAMATLAAPETQTVQAGQVTIKATWHGSDAGPIFTVVLDTHAVNLDAYDLSQLAVLRTDQAVDVVPMIWDAPAGGHHREGTLTFPLEQVDGSLVISGETRMIELRIRDVGGVPETVLTWVLS
jgi:hypothetical protein